MNVQEWTKQAEDYCPERVEVTKPAHELDREIKQIQSRLREREREYVVNFEWFAVKNFRLTFLFSQDTVQVSRKSHRLWLLHGMLIVMRKMKYRLWNNL